MLQLTYSVSRLQFLSLYEISQRNEGSEAIKAKQRPCHGTTSDWELRGGEGRWDWGNCGSWQQRLPLTERVEMKQNGKDVSIKTGLCVFCTGGGQKHNVGSWIHDVVARNYFFITMSSMWHSHRLLQQHWAAQEVRVPPWKSLWRWKILT